MRAVSSGLARGRAVDLTLRVLLPAAAALTLVSVLVGRARDVDHDLHVMAPEAVRAGASVPIRAHLYAGLRDPEGPRLVLADIAVELRGGGRVLARGKLAPSFASSLDGSLDAPADFVGPATLVARATVEDEAVAVERPLAIVRDAKPMVPAPRELRALQQLALGPVRAEAGAQAPDVLDVRVRAGACVPETPCEVDVRVGEPAAAIVVVATASVTPAPASARPSAETAGVVALAVTTHGPEAELRVEAHRAGARVATRSVRLPILLGVEQLSAIEAMLPAPARPRVRLSGEAGGCIVDAFHDGHWLRTGAITDCARGALAPFAPLDAGIWRIQARRDPFSADSAAVRAMVLRRDHEQDGDVLATLARAALVAAPDDAFAQAVAQNPTPHVTAFRASAGYLLALLEEGVVRQPAPASSLPAALDRLERERGRVHTYALVALAATALALTLLVARRGMRGGAEADRILTEAGSLRPPRRAFLLLRVAAVVASLLLAFAVIAVYLVLRIRGP